MYLGPGPAGGAVWEQFAPQPSMLLYELRKRAALWSEIAIGKVILERKKGDLCTPNCDGKLAIHRFARFGPVRPGSARFGPVRPGSAILVDFGGF